MGWISAVVLGGRNIAEISPSSLYSSSAEGRPGQLFNKPSPRETSLVVSACGDITKIALNGSPVPKHTENLPVRVINNLLVVIGFDGRTGYFHKELALVLGVSSGPNKKIILISLKSLPNVSEEDYEAWIKVDLNLEKAEKLQKKQNIKHGMNRTHFPREHEDNVEEEGMKEKPSSQRKKLCNLLVF
ncbi:hypothetical protein AVEN_238817-1 [Araneus ventricosus]|uniref:Uncharacterized protein n=1 Tax=Araneus ventricosus TaxID=182803 RepID=A0A4Y2QT98_ARAVE|nr:hypothetical protein AVEN_238817-1 [Araneus ventricosus]